MAKKPARTVASLSKKELKTARLGKPKFYRSAEFDKKPSAADFKKAKDKLAALPVPKPHAVKYLGVKPIKVTKEMLKPILATLPKRSTDEAWVDADEQLKKASKVKDKRKLQHPPSAIPVESDKPGIARNPKPPKVHVPLTADGAIVTLEIMSYHFLKRMERMAAEHGGTSDQAHVDVKADIAKGKTP